MSRSRGYSRFSSLSSVVLCGALSAACGVDAGGGGLAYDASSARGGSGDPSSPSAQGEDGATTSDSTKSTTNPSSSNPRSPSATCGKWENPVIPPNLPPVGDGKGHSDLQKVPEGLMLVDATGKPTTDLKCDADTVIFVHGWTSTGQATDFSMPAKWRGKNWNTFMFRWHRDSYDTELVPIEASKRTPAVAKKLAARIADLRTRLGGAGYTREIRLVGHSLGGLVVSFAGYEAFQAGEKGPRRIELLDPAYLLDVTPDDGQANGLAQAAAAEYSELGDMLVELGKRDVRIVTYNSIVAKLFGEQSTWQALNRQEMAASWLGALSFTDKHNEMIPYYFGSIDAPPPLTVAGGSAFSASFATSSIPKTAVHYSQQSGTSSVEIQDDTYK